MGYFYIRSLSQKKSSPNWKIQYISKKGEDTKDSLAKFPSRTWDIPKCRWKEYGLAQHLSLEEARDIASSLNAKEKIKRQEEQAKKFERKISEEQIRNKAYLPREFLIEFEKRFVSYRDSQTRQRQRRQSRSQTAWRAAQRLIKDIGLPPCDWFENTYEIYDWFGRNKYSISYTLKILKFTNLWGFYLCKKLGWPFLPVPNPRGYERVRLIELRYEGDLKRKGPSKPITPENLENVRGKIGQQNYNWVYLSIWFGLRPQEINNLQDDSTWRFETLITGRKVLWIYQTKLAMLLPEDRWKLIPIIFEEQELGLSIIMEKEFKKPICKTFKKYFGEGVSAYGGRKGFTDLMLERGQSIEAISQWMGHLQIDRTWRTYKERKKIKFTLK